MKKTMRLSCALLLAATAFGTAFGQTNTGARISGSGLSCSTYNWNGASCYSDTVQCSERCAQEYEIWQSSSSGSCGDFEFKSTYAGTSTCSCFMIELDDF